MTGKLAEKLPLTMSSLINTIPDSLYPEEDIPTSMNIFTNTESISHYSQMNTGKTPFYSFSSSPVSFKKKNFFNLIYFIECASRQKCPETAMRAVGNSCLRELGAPVCASASLLRTKGSLPVRVFRVKSDTDLGGSGITCRMTCVPTGHVLFPFTLLYFPPLASCQNSGIKNVSVSK